MKTHRLALLSLAFASCSEETAKTGDMAVSPDLAMSIDMAMRIPDGVKCGTQTCNTSMVCCIGAGAGGGVQYMCMAPGMCGDGAAEAKCDGPEDCSGAQPNCCVNVSFSAASDMGAGSPTGGGAMCITDCPPSVDLQTRMGQSKLCRTEADCVGYEGFLAFDGCCSSPQVPGVKFCAPKSATFMNLGGYTCN